MKKIDMFCIQEWVVKWPCKISHEEKFQTFFAFRNFWLYVITIATCMLKHYYIILQFKSYNMEIKSFFYKIVIFILYYMYVYALKV